MTIIGLVAKLWHGGGGDFGRGQFRFQIGAEIFPRTFFAQPGPDLRARPAVRGCVDLRKPDPHHTLSSSYYPAQCGPTSGVVLFFSDCCFGMHCSPTYGCAEISPCTTIQVPKVYPAKSHPPLKALSAPPHVGPPIKRCGQTCSSGKVGGGQGTT